MRIGTKLTLLLLAAVASVMASFGYIRVQQERERLIAELQQETLLLANAIKPTVEHALRDRLPQDIQDLLVAMAQRPNPVDRIRIFDPQLKDIYNVDSDTAATIVIPRAELEDTLKTGHTLARYLESSDRPSAYVLLPIRSRRGAIIGVLEVARVATRVHRQIRDAMRDNVIRLTLLSATIGLVIWLTVRVSIRRPIADLVRTAQAFGHGNLDRRIATRRRDEFGQLASAFNHMATELQRAQGERMAQARARLELERQLQQGQKLAAVGRLASEVAHEVGTPLNLISGRAESIRKGLPPDHPLERHVGIILRQTERISGIIRQILDYTRPRRPAIGPVAVGPALTRLVDLLEPLAQRREVEIVTEVTAGLPLILADPDLLQDALVNLVTNALDATPPGGRVCLAATDAIGSDAGMPDVTPRIRRGTLHNPCVTVTVADTGKGIPAQRLDKIFEPFFSTKETGRGTGLGLAIVEEIVRAHGAAIEIASAEGRGTSVMLHWPIARVAAGQTGDAAGEHAAETDAPSALNGDGETRQEDERRVHD